MALADQLMFSEKKDWLDYLKKLDSAQQFRTNACYIHWFQQKAGPMQKNQNLLHYSRKQSIWKRWKVTCSCNF